MSLYDQLDDEDLIEQLLVVARWLTQDAARQDDRAQYLRLGKMADICRQSATRFEQLMLMLKGDK